MNMIKNLFHDLLVLGCDVSTERLIVMLSLLYDKSFDSDYDVVEFNGNVLFVERSVLFFFAENKLRKNQQQNNEAISELDSFIAYYKELLLKAERYELIAYLSL